MQCRDTVPPVGDRGLAHLPELRRTVALFGHRARVVRTSSSGRCQTVSRSGIPKAVVESWALWVSWNQPPARLREFSRIYQISSYYASPRSFNRGVPARWLEVLPLPRASVRVIMGNLSAMKSPAHRFQDVSLLFEVLISRHGGIAHVPPRIATRDRTYRHRLLLTFAGVRKCLPYPEQRMHRVFLRADISVTARGGYTELARLKRARMSPFKFVSIADLTPKRCFARVLSFGLFPGDQGLP